MCTTASSLGRSPLKVLPRTGAVGHSQQGGRDVGHRTGCCLLPFTLRYQLAFDATLTAAVLDVFIRRVFAGLRRAAVRAGIADAQGGALTAIQRFGSAMNANVHFHSLVLDGVFSRPAPGEAPVFHPLPAPTDEEIAQILEQIHDRVTRLLRRCGRLPEDPSPPDPVAEQMPLLAGYAAASIQERIATGPRAGQPVRRLRTAAAVGDGATLRCARREGFSLHAKVALPAHAREPLEHLCRYLLRPPLAMERLTESSGASSSTRCPTRAGTAPHICCWTPWSSSRS